MRLGTLWVGLALSMLPAGAGAQVTPSHPPAPHGNLFGGARVPGAAAALPTPAIVDAPIAATPQEDGAAPQPEPPKTADSVSAPLAPGHQEIARDSSTTASEDAGLSDGGDTSVAPSARPAANPKTQKAAPAELPKSASDELQETPEPPEVTASGAPAAPPKDSSAPVVADASPSRRCTSDGRSCINVKSYVKDVCTVIERAAGENRLDPNFLARLLWKESMFEPEAVSPVGALGIAQFMPGTARLRKLDDPFNPAKAIHASADYLRDLIDGFGNMGLAAVAYNGGENRALRFFNGGTVLPYETQDYVEAITGHNAWKWRDSPPGELDLRLDKKLAFRDACVKLAGKRTLKEFATQQRAWPWGVIVASHPQQSGAQQQVNRLNRQLRPILGGKRVSYVRKQLSGSARRVFTAQVGYSSRTEAAAFCNRLRSLGGRCIVLKN